MRRQPHLVRYPRVTLACGRIPIEPGHGGEATRAQAGWLEQAEEGVGRGALLLASATFLRKLLNHHRNREKVKFYDLLKKSSLFLPKKKVETENIPDVGECDMCDFIFLHIHARFGHYPTRNEK